MTLKEKKLFFSLSPKYIIFVLRLHHKQCHRITNVDLTLRRCPFHLCLSSESLLGITIPDSTVEDGWCWRLLHFLDNAHQSFTTGKFFHLSELKPSSCKYTCNIFCYLVHGQGNPNSFFFSESAFYVFEGHCAASSPCSFTAAKEAQFL